MKCRVKKSFSSSTTTSAHLICSCICFIIFLVIQKASAQNATTDPLEVKALNSIFEKWDAQAAPGWNISGEPCSGIAIDATDFEDDINNPGIKCDCSYNNNKTCHITHLRVHELNKKGEIPEELQSLQYLQQFKIQKNYFTGTLPAFIGNLSRLTMLDVGHNAFSGSIPKEFGNLKELIMLAIGSNNFSGTLPLELGNIIKLEKIFIDSSGVGGVIPSTFANLRNMQILWAQDCPLTGEIPDFIGNWTKLQSLRLQGNSFEGSIPSSFSNLNALTHLEINDMYNSSSSLDFIKSMKNLTYLSLRNALINGKIPSDIGNYQMLQTLDLGFNNLTGQIPSSLFKISSLTHLFLGNNSLSGILPSEKSENLTIIDLSYNYLSGTFPSWVTSDLQLNLVANNFTFDSSNSSVFPGLNCLQRNFPCYRNNPLYTNFSIKCGGPEMTAGGIMYEAENSTLGAASFYVTSKEKWAVSNVDFAIDNRSNVQNDSDGVLVTLFPELYQTSRTSLGSLRYFGLGLKNGRYNVSLLFAETLFSVQRSETWASVGKRYFDIYIQGTREEKDFDISKEAGDAKRAVTKTFDATVSDNHLEIHLFWAGKGTCCIPTDGSYGPLISALSVIPDSNPNLGGTPQKKSKTGLIVGIAVPLASLTLILICIVYYVKRKTEDDDEEVLLGIGPKPNTFSYAELRSATKDFDPSNKLGEGGFGPVYKGKLSDGRVAAVKQLSRRSHQGKNQLINEIATISAVRHRNLVKLYGCCIEGTKRLLVYEYLENRSLDQVLFGNNHLHLDWPTRFRICLGTARGLAYLHEESMPRIVHRDVKASNILLDAQLCPKISDFGLAKLYDDTKTHISTGIAGTIGYLAPEYAMRGHLTEKADIFSFGVVVLEIISGRANSDTRLDRERIYLLEWAWTLHEDNKILELLDPTLTEFNEDEVLRVIGVALLCTQASPMLRPPMSQVVNMLTGVTEVGTVTSKPGYLSDWSYKDLTNLSLSEDSLTSSSKIANRSSGKKSQRDNPTDLSSGAEPLASPTNLSQLNDIIAGGR